MHRISRNSLAIILTIALLVLSVFLLSISVNPTVPQTASNNSVNGGSNGGNSPIQLNQANGNLFASVGPTTSRDTKSSNYLPTTLVSSFSVNTYTYRNGFFVYIGLDPASSSFTAFASDLVKAHVAYIYIDAGDLGQTALLQPRIALADYQAYIRAFKEAAPGYDFIFLGWVGNSNPQTLLSNYQSASIRSTIQELRGVGFNGINLDIEPVPNQTPAFLSFLSTFRNQINSNFPGFILSNDAMNIVQGAQPGDTWSWDPSYYASVTTYLDQVVPMLYESGSSTFQEYQSWIDNQIQLLNIYSKTQVEYAIPNWYEPDPWHDPSVENLQNAVRIFDAYLASHNVHNLQGLTIFTGSSVTGVIQGLETTNADLDYFATYWGGSAVQYIVEAGDTLSAIGQRLGVNWQIIAAANGIQSPYIIYVGEGLFIPLPDPGCYIILYTVQPGETLWGVAHRHNTTSQAIIEANPGVVPPALQSGSNYLPAGTLLKIPIQCASTPPYVSYTVQAGDSLWLIGQKFGVSWQTIAQLNGISSPYIIYVGEVLRIP
jgi:LysM repeat protein